MQFGQKEIRLKFIDQTILHSEEKNGNCTQAAVASLIGLDLNDVPDFANTTESSIDFWSEFYAFFEGIGMHAIMIPNNMEPDCNYLASGISPRGISHMVVMNDGNVVHDPHPSRAGIASVEAAWIIVPDNYFAK